MKFSVPDGGDGSGADAGAGADPSEAATRKRKSEDGECSGAPRRCWEEQHSDEESEPSGIRSGGGAAGGDSQSLPLRKRRELEESSCGSTSVSRLTITDPDVFDCTICFGPLTPPLFQCTYGHVACFPCWSRLEKKCHICSSDTSLVRCIALEKVIECLRSSCQYVNHGCSKTFPYIKKAEHEDACQYAPCNCPIPGCSYKGSAGHWLDHFRESHRCAATPDWKYNDPIRSDFSTTQPHLYYLGQDGNLFLLVNRNEGIGFALSVVRLPSCNVTQGYAYELATFGSPTVLQIKGPVPNVQEWTRGRDALLAPAGQYRERDEASAFLLVPRSFVGCRMVVSLTISKVEPDW